MIARLARTLRRIRASARSVIDSDSRRFGPLELWYPRLPWYTENAPAMLEIVERSAAALERELRLPLPEPTVCQVTTPRGGRSHPGRGRRRVQAHDHHRRAGAPALNLRDGRGARA